MVPKGSFLNLVISHLVFLETHPPSNVSYAKIIVFQTPTHLVIISNLGWCFFVENSVETFKDVAKVEHPWNNFGKFVTQQNLWFLPQEKKAPFF